MPDNDQRSLLMMGGGIFAFVVIVVIIIFIVLQSQKKEEPLMQVVPIEYQTTPFYMPASRDPSDIPKERERLKPRTDGIIGNGNDPLKNKEFEEGGQVHTYLNPILERRVEYINEHAPGVTAEIQPLQGRVM